MGLLGGLSSNNDFFGKKIGNNMHICVFSSVNSIDFAIFLKNQPNFSYEKIAKKKKTIKNPVINYQLVIF